MLNIILYQPEIPPNTANIIRTAYSLGAKLHIIKPIAFDLSPKFLKRASAGKYLSDIQHEVHKSYNDFYKKYGQVNIYYITRYGLKNYSEPNFGNEHKDKDIFVMFGCESTGIPKEIMQTKIENCLRIPMISKARSLNLANSVVILGYEINRQLNFEGLSKVEVQKGKDFILKND